MEITPAILSDSLIEVQQQINLVAEKTPFSRIQIDIVDPEFADDTTITPIDLLEVDLRGLQVDMHLMTNDPINDVVESTQVVGIHSIIAQIERMSSQSHFIDHVHSFALNTGFSLDLYTPIEEVEDESWGKLAVVQVMGNKAGIQGEEFAAAVVLPKIKKLVKKREQLGLSFVIAVDIGMNPETISLCQKTGADVFAVGSYLWESSDFQAAVEPLTSSR